MGLAGIIGNVAQGALGLAGLFSQDNAYNKSLAFSREQFEYQKQLHQNQIQWRVSDAQKAGLHPMAALGLSSSSFSPVSTPSVPDYGSGYSNLGDAAASLGQNIDSAILAGKNKEEREAAQSLQQKAADISLQKGEAELEGIKLENDQKRWFLQQQMFPRTPAVTKNPVIGGQGDASYSLDTPYGKDLYNLFTIARHGDTLTEVPHPDIADSITESEWKNIIAHIDAELQAETGTIKPPVYLLTPSERKAVREHRYELVRVPGIGWKLDRKPSRPNPYDKLSKYEKFKRQSTLRYGNDRQSVSGKIFW